MTPRPLQARWDVLLDEAIESGPEIFEDPGARTTAQMGTTRQLLVALSADTFEANHDASHEFKYAARNQLIDIFIH